MTQTYSMIFAAEPGGNVAERDIGHCWVAVEYPKRSWIVRGFYPNTGTLDFLGAKGIVMDDWNRFRSDAYRMRTRTQRGLTEEQVRAARMQMLSYTFDFGKRIPPKPFKGKGGGMQRFDTPAQEALVRWSVFGQQCAWYAIDACRAAGFDPAPFTMRTPWDLHRALGRAGEIDAKHLPHPFGRGPA